MNKIPVTILTGFLGAGKTTLLNRIIEQNKSVRFAIIENEFGEINIDSELVIGVEDGIFEMDNGCICCTLNGALSETLKDLIERSSSFDHLLIETTGIADPAAVAASFLSDYTIQQNFQLNGTIGIVDALHINQVLNENKESIRQIGFSDYILLNKTKGIDPEKINALKSLVKKLNPFATIEICDHANIETTPLLQVKAFDIKVIEQKTALLTKQDFLHHHISSQSYILPGDFDFLKLQHFFKVLVSVQSMRIYRMKAVLSIAGESQRLIFQAVHQQIVFTKGSPWKEEEERISKIVVIGNNLNWDRFEKRLRACF